MSEKVIDINHILKEKKGKLYTTTGDEELDQILAELIEEEKSNIVEEDFKNERKKNNGRCRKTIK